MGKMLLDLEDGIAFSSEENKVNIENNDKSDITKP